MITVQGQQSYRNPSSSINPLFCLAFEEWVLGGGGLIKVRCITIFHSSRALRVTNGRLVVKIFPSIFEVKIVDTTD